MNPPEPQLKPPSASGGDDTDICIGNLHITGDTADTACETEFGIP